jgi:ABC-type multidrug transport system fused ATPase/permease subunit
MSRAQVRIILQFMRPYAWAYGVIFALVLVVSVLESVNLLAFFPVFQVLLGEPASSAAPGIFAGVAAVASVLPGPPVVSAVALLGSLVAVKACLSLVKERLIARESGAVLYDAKQQLVRRFVEAPYGYFLDTKQGVLLHTTLIAPQKLGVQLLRVPQVAAELCKIVAIIGVLWAAWPAATCALAAVGAGYTMLTHAIGRRISYNSGSGKITALTEQSTVLNEFLTGIRHIMATASQRVWADRFERTNRTYRDLYVRDLFWMAVPQHIMEVTAVGLMIGAVLLVRWGGQGGAGASLPILGVFTVALVRLLPALSAFGRLRMEMLGTMPDVERIHEMLTQPVPPRRDGTRGCARLGEGVAFERVSFSHEGRAPLLQDVSFVLRKGTTVALVGPSGSGKSTVVNLLLGLFEPGSGRIAIDGVPLGDYRLTTWLERVGLVPQEPFIYHATAAENILFGRAGIPREQIIQAARVANAHEFITELPQGYDTVIGERGMKLSGGQQQRLAIARAVLSDPDLLIFDEATSHLDAIAEKQVQEAIEAIARDRTVLIVAHRLSTVRGADEIIVLDRGRIVERGSHDELWRRQERYYELVTSSA